MNTANTLDLRNPVSSLSTIEFVEQPKWASNVFEIGLKCDSNLLVMCVEMCWK